MSTPISAELETLLEITRGLKKLNVAYMLTGSLAKSFYSTPRMTRDIDIVVELKSQDVDRVLGGLSPHFYSDRISAQEAVQREGMFNLLHNTHQVKVDFVIRKSDPYRKTEFSRRQKALINGEELWIVSPEDLILSKLQWAKDSLSEIQLIDVRDLLSFVKNLDYTYLQDWVNTLGLGEIYKKVRP